MLRVLAGIVTLAPTAMYPESSLLPDPEFSFAEASCHFMLACLLMFVGARLQLQAMALSFRTPVAAVGIGAMLH